MEAIDLITAIGATASIVVIAIAIIFGTLAAITDKDWPQKCVIWSMGVLAAIITLWGASAVICKVWEGSGLHPTATGRGIVPSHPIVIYKRSDNTGENPYSDGYYDSFKIT